MSSLTKSVMGRSSCTHYKWGFVFKVFRNCLGSEMMRFRWKWSNFSMQRSQWIFLDLGSIWQINICLIAVQKDTLSFFDDFIPMIGRLRTSIPWLWKHLAYYDYIISCVFFSGGCGREVKNTVTFIFGTLNTQCSDLPWRAAFESRNHKVRQTVGVMKWMAGFKKDVFKINFMYVWVKSSTICGDLYKPLMLSVLMM